MLNVGYYFYYRFVQNYNKVGKTTMFICQNYTTHDEISFPIENRFYTLLSFGQNLHFLFSAQIFNYKVKLSERYSDISNTPLFLLIFNLI